MTHRYNIGDLDSMDHRFAGMGDTDDEYGWSPLPILMFSRILERAIRAAPGNFFMEAGSGIGTKLYRARQRGLWEVGVENKPELLKWATSVLHVRAFSGDVRDMPYDLADIVYISRPFKDDDEEVKYERMVHDRVRNGAVLMSAWAGVKPPWEIIFRLGQHGVWRKPVEGKPVPRIPVPDEYPSTLDEYEAMIRRAEPLDPLVRKR